jgi:putative heme-binding domain-containing protein
VAVELGPSCSGPIVAGDRVFTTESKDKKFEVVIAFHRKTGKELWRAQWEGAMTVPFFAKSNGDWIRATPACDGESLFVAGMRLALSSCAPTNSLLVRPIHFSNVVPMHFSFRSLRGLIFIVPGLAINLCAAPAEAEAEKTALAVEAISRLQNVDLDANPKLREAVLRVLDKTRGTSSFVKLVQQFKLTNQNAGLLEVALAQPAGESGVDAMRLILASGDAQLLEETLAGSNTVDAVRAAEALGNTGDKRTTEFLLPIVTDGTRDLRLRKQAVQSLAKTSGGANRLLELARAGKLTDDLKFTASAELNAARWPEIKRQAAEVLPAATGHNAQPLPPLSKLLAMPGDVANGARLFTNASPGCANCHVINGRGVELGPNLSEIGGKLGKDALIEAILEPSSGVSFGYEAFNLTLKNGDEAYGLITSESAEEVSIKAVGGIITRLKKSDIVSRQQSRISIMPAGLHEAMTSQELVDLVSYLASLKKTEETAPH